MQWRAFVDAQWTELAALRGARRPASTCASRRGPRRRARGRTSTTSRRSSTRGRVRGLVPKEKLPLYNVFYEARTLARGAAGLHDDGRRRALRRPRLRPRLRHARARGLRGHLVARRPDAPPLVRGRRARREPLRVALPRRHRRDAARDDRDARRATTRRRSPTPTSSAPTTASSSTAAASSRRTGACSSRPPRFREGFAGRHGRPRSHPPPAHREHDLARRPGGLLGRGADADARRGRRRHDRPDGRARRSRSPCPSNKSFFLPAERAAEARRATSSARTCSTRSPSASATTSRRPAASRRSASRSRAAATACSSWPSRAAGSTCAGPTFTRLRARPRRASSCAPSTCRRATRRPRRAPPPSTPRATSDAPLGSCRSTTRSSASSRRSRRCCSRARRSRRWPGRTCRRASAPSACGRGPTAPRVCSCRRAT